MKPLQNARMSPLVLEAALNDIISEYTRFELPKFWGKGRSAIADGTHIKLRENNLIGEQHIRYGSYGGIAYHHISDTYIALFSNFISCGVWEMDPIPLVFCETARNKTSISEQRKQNAWCRRYHLEHRQEENGSRRTAQKAGVPTPSNEKSLYSQKEW